jgi:predicted secreted hydrolase
VVAGLTLAAGLAGCGTDLLYELTPIVPPLQLPRDEAPHCYGGEWWYYTGRVATEDGRGFGLEMVVFHDAHLPLIFLTEAWAAHFAVLDESTGAFTYDQVRWFDPGSFNCPIASGFDLYTPLVQMSGDQGRDQVHAAMVDGSYAVDLTVSDARGPVLHGDQGLVPYGKVGRSFYYSRPAMQASGTVHVNGQPLDVSGTLWFDRQWGRDLRDPWLAWDWYSLRLDDGANVMLFVFRETEPVVALGTYIPPGDPPRALGADDFAIRPTAFWISSHTGGTYPVAWEIDIFPEDLVLTVNAVARDQELDARSTTLNIYWEGLCGLSGRRGDEPVTGLAYVELTNYVRLPAWGAQGDAIPGPP